MRQRIAKDKEALETEKRKIQKFKEALQAGKSRRQGSTRGRKAER